ncbi:MAG: glycosyltransferase family 2 protein, partial [Desulfobulbus sp.]
MEADPFVDIVIPTWNGRELLEPCLKSIVGQSYKRFQITVVDNGSTDGTVSFLQEEFPDVQVVSFPVNTGFSVAVNAGIQAGTHPLIFLLNNDTELAPDCLEQLVDASLLNSHQFFAAKM